MKPPPFEYKRVDSASEAASLLKELGADARILAGGQSLIPLMNLRLASPACLVDISRVDELDYIRFGNGNSSAPALSTLSIGAAATQRDVELHAEALRVAPVLAEAISNSGVVPVRHRGTVVGSVAHADPSAEIPAAFLAQGGSVEAVSAEGAREIPSEDFFEGVFTTALQEGEFVSAIRVAEWPSGSGHGFRELSVTAESWPVATASALIHLTDGVADRVSVVLGGVGSTPLRRPEAESIMLGGEPTTETIAEAAAAAAAGLDPPSDTFGSGNYRRKIARVLTRRALADAVSRAGGKQ